MFHEKKNINKVIRIRPENKQKGYLYLNRNERTIPIPKLINEKIIRELSKINIGVYPEVSFLYNELSKFNKTNENKIFITEGVTGAIKLIIDSVDSSVRKNILFPHPTFSLYDVFVKINGFKSIKIPYTKKNYSLNYSKLIKSINSKSAILFLPNPNVPIEGYLDQNKIIKIADKCQKNKCLLVIDEVYYHYGSKSAVNLIDKYENIIILRSLSKGFGLPGLRVGYIISSKQNIKYLSNNRVGYEANSLTIAASNVFLKDKNYLKKYTSEIKSSLLLIKNKMKSLNIKTVGGDYGNYIFIDFQNKIKCKYISKELFNQKIVVRSNWPKPFDTGILVSGTSIKNTNIFLKKLLIIIQKN